MDNRYPISTLEQMGDIPLDALPRFLAEFPLILANVAAMRALSKLSGAALDMGEPVWIDDDKHTSDVSIECGGEVIFHEQRDTRTGQLKENSNG